MDLTDEDKLRLNVLLAQSLQAIRIDESRMEVYALSDKGEAKVALHANCKDEKYLKLVRQWLSTHVLGSPGGYPVFMRRWTRMGQGVGEAREDSLEKLLLLGEPEAIVAVVHANGVTDEIARRAWWCEPNAENARCLLRSEDVVNGNMGPELAKFLVEFLPFEESSRAMMNSVRLVLQSSLIDEATKEEIWKRGKRRNTFYVGFLQQCSHDLPIDTEPHPDFHLSSQIDNQDQFSEKLKLIFSPQGQAAIETFKIVLNKPNDQDVAVEIFKTLGNYFHIRPDYPNNWRDIDELSTYTNDLTKNHGKAIIKQWPQAESYIFAILFLSMINESLLDPIFGVTDSIGSVMRKRIAHLTVPIIEQLKILS
ncbi:MAG: DsrS [Pseudomonadota bacterium]